MAVVSGRGPTLSPLRCLYACMYMNGVVLRLTEQKPGAREGNGGKGPVVANNPGSSGRPILAAIIKV